MFNNFDAELNIFITLGLYIYELIIFAKNNITLLQTWVIIINIQQEIKNSYPSPNTHLYYNNLPLELKNVKYITKFKQKLKQLPLAKPLYS